MTQKVEETITLDPDVAVADYGDYEIHIKQASASNRLFLKEASSIEQRYSRKERMADQGLISKEGIEILTRNKLTEMAAVYADHIVKGWKGTFRGKPLPAYNRENVIKILAAKENDLLFGDIIQFAIQEANFHKEIEDEEIKN